MKKRKNSVKKSEPTFATFHTGNKGLNEMFGGDGIFYPKDGSFLGVVFGTAGSGKSILALQLCCCCTFPEQKNSEKRVVYLSHEPEDVVVSRLEKFQYFNNRDGRVFHPFTKNDRGKWFRQKGLHIVSMPLDRPSQVDVLTNVIDLAGEATKTEKGGKVQWLVVFDNAETIASEAYQKAFAMEKDAEFNPTYSPKDGIFFKSIRNHFAKKKVSSFFFFEEPGDQEESFSGSEVSQTAQAYAADIVIHLSRQNVSGYRERTIEIVKARNQFHLRGRHHFSIVGTRKNDKGQMIQPADDRDEMGIVIYPSLAARTHRLRTKKKNEGKIEKDKPGLGITELDKVLGKSDKTDATDKSVKKNKMTNNQGIQQGSSNVLVADLDDRATDLALHFALNGIRPKSPKTLYISFQKNVTELQALASRFWDENVVMKLLNEQKDAPCRVLYLTPEHISDGKLLQDIELALNYTNTTTGKRDVTKVRPRVVIDNIFSIEFRFPLLQNPKHFFATLFAILKDRKVTTFLVDAVESGEHENPIDKSMVAGLADNVFLLRHVEFQSKSRSVFSILKRQGKPAPEKYWELNEKELTKKELAEKKKELKKRKALPAFYGNTELQAADTFDFFRDVLTGDPKPVEITLGVYSEGPGSPLHRYLQAQKTSFTQTFGQSFKMEIYGAEEYARMQRSLEIASVLPRSDCHIVAIDEFWLYKLIRDQLLENLYQPFEELPAKEKPPNREDFITCAHDIALFLHREWEQSNLNNERYAIAVRNNCGLICCNRKELSSLKLVEERNPLHKWIETGIATRDVTWDKIVKLKSKFDKIQEMQQNTEGHKSASTPTVFFTFCMEHLESCVSFLLELALSTCEKPKTIFEKNESGKRRVLDLKEFEKALKYMLQLIDEKDLELLENGWFRKHWDEPQTLFSRQWWSTLGCQRSRGWPEAITKEEKELMTPESIKKLQEGNECFRSLEAIELPCGKKGKPTPISGSWYLGILKGSAAIKAGVRIINQFCQHEDDEYKMRNYIGMPVRKEFYRKPTSGLHPYSLPYAKQFIKLADEKDKSDFTAPFRWLKSVLRNTCPFYRMQIDDYDIVAPILYRMMSKAAQDMLAIKDKKRSEKQILKCAKRAVDMGINQYAMFKKQQRRQVTKSDTSFQRTRV